MGQSIALVVEPPELGGDARQLLDPAAPDEEQDEIADAPVRSGASSALDDFEPLLERGPPGWRGHAPAPCRSRSRRQHRVPSATSSIGLVAQGDLEGGLGVAAGGRRGSGHQPSNWRLGRAGLGEELLDEPALALVRHRLADDLAGGGQGEVGDLRADLGDGPDLLGLDLGGGAHAHPLELLAGRGDVRVAGLLGDLLGAGQDLVRLAARLGQGGEPLLLRALAILASLLGVLEALLDPRLAVGEHLRDGLERERPDDREEDHEVGRGDDHLEQVDLEQRLRCVAFRRTTSRVMPDATARRSTMASPCRPVT